MPVVVERIKRAVLESRDLRFRDRRGYYASSLGKDMRDLYWEATGEPETNPTDLVGSLRMNCGTWIEKGIVNDVLTKLHLFGMHLLSNPNKQTPIGGSDPGIDGYLDGLLVERKGDEFSKKPWALEIKTKYGYGATLFKQSYEVSEDYCFQLGYYLRELHRKGVTNRGLFLFVLIGDNTLGEIVEILAKYEAETDEVVLWEANHIDGTSVALNQRVRLQPALDRLKALDGYVARRELPPVDKQHKYPLTAELLSEASDTVIRAMVKGEKVLGDWQIAYSRFKQKHLELQGAGYTAEEMQQIHAEYSRRFPKGRLHKKEVA